MRSLCLSPLFAFLLLLAGCTQPVTLVSPASAPPTLPPGDILPTEAVIRAAEAPVSGTFLMTVRATGRADGRLYLNSEPDYRDQRCLTISIRPELEESLRARLGNDVRLSLLDRQIRVRGTAQRVKISFVSANGRQSDKYYYQTHVVLRTADDLSVVLIAP
jgi:hypothetical protein